MLSDAEKRFISRALRLNMPGTFVSHHLWLCRKLAIEPDVEELVKMDELCSKVILELE